MEDNYRLIGIGNALSDIVVDVSDSFLHRYDLIKGTMLLFDEHMLLEMLQALDKEELEVFPGGSCGNTIAVFANLGGKGGFIGKVGDDDYGRKYRASLETFGIQFLCPLTENAISGSCMVMVTPDAQRTMATSLGVAANIQPSDIDENIIKKASAIYLEGYLYDKDDAKAALEKAAKIARQNDAEISLSLSDIFCIERHRDDFLKLINESCDIIFGNEQEFYTLYDVSSRDEIIAHLQGLNKIFCFTLGADGAIIIKGDEKYVIPPYRLGETRDTTGAGDNFAGGFLYGFHHDLSLEQSGHLGSLLAGDVVTHHGPRSVNNVQELMKKHLDFQVP